MLKDNFPKMNISVSMTPTSAFPLDGRTLFDNMDELHHAAMSAVEVGSYDSNYYFGQLLTYKSPDSKDVYIYKIINDPQHNNISSIVNLTEEDYNIIVESVLDTPEMHQMSVNVEKLVSPTQDSGLDYTDNGLHVKIPEVSGLRLNENGLSLKLKENSGLKIGNDGLGLQIEDSSATIARKTGNVVTLKTGVVETNGTIKNASGTDIVLKEIAVTGMASDISYDNNGTDLHSDNVQSAINEINDKITGNSIDVQINGNTIVNDEIANIVADGTYDKNSNKIATQSTVTNEILNLSVGGYCQANISTTPSPSKTVLAIKGISETNGKITEDSEHDVSVVIDGEYNSSTNKIATIHSVNQVVNSLNGSALIATQTGNIVTIKRNVNETNGVIANGVETDILLKEVAVTGTASDISITDVEGKITATTVEDALTELALTIEALEGSFDVIVSVNAETTPYGVTWGSVTGTLVASAETFRKIYFVPMDGGMSNTYSEYLTTRHGTEGEYVYAWEQLGSLGVDLTGYVKTITVNGKTYEVISDSTNINLGSIVTSVTGETLIQGGNSDFVSVQASSTINSSDGSNSVVLSSNVKTHSINTATTESNGLATAYDVKDYFNNETSDFENTGNKVTSLSASSTDSQYPSAKCVYDLIGSIDTALNIILNGTN